ncbi:hypothetical protein [Flavobacterium sp.]|uniref:hypothetical protein n=1 Tax=Flavobacterium sp. TaxID=239 RepID=UPI0035B3D88B
MRNLVYLFAIITLLISCKSKKKTDEAFKEEMKIVLVKPNEVENIKINRAYDLGKRLLETCNTSTFKVFSKDEATEKVIANATPEKIATTCKKINLRNGKFLSLDLIDIKFNPISEEYYFRYNIQFEKKLFKRELFVTINKENKVAAISTKEVKAKPL